MPGEELPPVVAEFDANSTDFDEVVDHIEERLEVLSKIDATPEVGLDDAEFDDKLMDILTRFESLNDLRATAEAYLDGDEFNDRYEEIIRLMERLESMYADPTVDLDDAAFERKFDYIQGKMALLERSINANMDLSIGEFETEYTLIEGQIAALEAQSPITIQVVAQEEGLGAITAANEAWMAAQKTQNLFSLSQLPADLAALSGGGGGGGGGGGVAGFLGGLGFGRHRIPGTGLGIPLAGFGTLGAMAGGGVESALLTGVGVAGSGIGALLGGAALGTAGLGVAAVGGATDLAGVGQATGDIKQYTTLTGNEAQAAAVYGKGSTEYAAAQYAYQQWAADLSKATISALSTASATAANFHALFDKATADAETTGANIENQAMQVGEKFLPTIGKYAAQNTNIIQASLQPLFAWMQGPGLNDFNVLEETFQEHLPAAMGAFDNGIELLMRLITALAPQTGTLIDKLDNLFTRLNGADFGHFLGEVENMIGIYHVWSGLIKNVADGIYELFHHDAGTGTAIIADLSRMIALFDKWAAGPEGGDKLHEFMESHKQEILSILDLLPHLISAFGGIELFVDPPLRELIALLAQAADILLSTPIIGQILAMAVAFELLSHRIGFLPSLVPMLKSLAIDGVQFLGSALTALGSATGIETLETLGGKLSSFGTTAPTAMEAAATSMSGAADSMAASSAQIVAALEAVGGAADTMAGQVEGSAVASETSLSGLAGATKLESGLIVPGSVAGAGVAGGAVEGEVIGGGAVAGGASTAAIASAAAAAVPIAIATVGAGALVAGIVGLVRTANQGSASTFQQATTREQENPQGSVGMGGLVTNPGVAQGANATIGGWASAIEALTKSSPGLNPTMAANVAQLSAATGLAAPKVEQLASELKINLGSALSPGAIEQFTNYVRGAGGATATTAQLTKAASENIQASLQAMETKAQQAMPAISGAARNMVTAASPALVTLVADMKKSGDQSGALWVSAYLAHLTPAELASKNLHDKVKSPLVPLEEELRQVGDKSAANMIASFISKGGTAGSASQSLASAIENPLYDLQTKMASTGDLSGSAIVEKFEQHNPSASTQAGLMKEAIEGKLTPLITDLQKTGDSSGANLVSGISQQAAKGNWNAVGESIDSGIAGGITAHTGEVTQAAAGLASAASAATARVLKSSSPSRVFHDIGRGIPEGLANGINEIGHVAASAAAGLGGATISAASSGGGAGANVDVGGVHLHGDTSSFDPDEVGAAVAGAVRQKGLRRARTMGSKQGYMGPYAGSR